MTGKENNLQDLVSPSSCCSLEPEESRANTLEQGWWVAVASPGTELGGFHSPLVPFLSCPGDLELA